MGKFSVSVSLSLFFSLWLSHILGCYLTLASSNVLRAFRPSPYPKHATHVSLSSPSSGGLDCLGYFSPGSCGLEHILWVFCFVLFFFFFFFPVMLPCEIPKLPTDLLVRGYPVIWKLLHNSLCRMGLHPYLFCLSFCLLYFVLPPFEENGLPFWVPDVLCQCSKVVLWKLLSIQMML